MVYMGLKQSIPYGKKQEFLNKYSYMLTSYSPSSLALQPGPASELNAAVTGLFIGNVSQDVISGCICQCFFSIYHCFSNYIEA